MDPSEFFLKYYSKVLVAPFHDASFYSPDLSKLLELGFGDKTSIPKLRSCAISMTLFLGSRAVREAAIMNFGQGFQSIEAITSVAIKAEVLADAIIEEARIKVISPSLPLYVDESYFSKWKDRYHQCAQEYKQGELRQATVLTCYRQCTLSYGNEYAVIAAEEKILDQVVSIYDIYLDALRNLLGQEILN